MNHDLKDESGMTLVESLMAILILLFGLLTMAQILAFSVIASKNYGRDAGKTAVCARDRMEQLVGLAFTDTGLAAGGSVYPSAPVTGYADYLNQTGGTTSSSSAGYIRQWQIVNDSASVKRIIVSVTSNRSFRYGRTPSTTLVTLKTQ